MSNNVVLLVDEQAPRRSLHAFGLRCADLVVEEATHFEQAQRRIVEQCPGLVLIVRSRFDHKVRAFVSRLRAHTYTRDLPVVLAAAQATRSEAAYAHQCGASDFIFGSVEPEALVARVRAGLPGGADVAASPTGIADLTIDGHEVRRGSRAAALRPTERRLLQFMVGHPDRVIPRDLLLFRVWGGATNLDSRVVDVTVCRLRRALAELGCGEVLQTVNRHGYRLMGRALTEQSITNGSHP
jgi:two-component system, OmpR family, phosphate regulon response regulator PhoB